MGFDLLETCTNLTMIVVILAKKYVGKLLNGANPIKRVLHFNSWQTTMIDDDNGLYNLFDVS